MHACITHTHTHTHTHWWLTAQYTPSFLSILATEIIWVLQHSLILLPGNKNIHLILTGGSLFSIFHRSRFFTVSGEWQPGHGMNWSSQSVISFGHFLKTLHKTCNEQRPLQRLGKVAEGSLLLQATLGYIKNALSNRRMMSAFLMWCFWDFFDILHDFSIILFLGEFWRLLK